MIAVLSPSKDLDFKKEIPFTSDRLPYFRDEISTIVQVMKKKSPNALMKLMDISEKLAIENVNRYAAFDVEFKNAEVRPAVFAFSGDVYRGLDSYSLHKKQIDYCDRHLRILSGLYGMLQPLDLMQAYRLEMGLPLKVARKKNLYEFWKKPLTGFLNETIKNSKSTHLINLASQEYFSAIEAKDLSVPVINIHFREFRNNRLSFLSYNAKRARGLMARYMALNNCLEADSLKGFNLEQYSFDGKLSNDTEWFFVR